MGSSVNILWTTITILQVAVGITLNSWIVSFSFESLKTRSSNPTNLIYFIMGLLNVFMDVVFTIEAFLFIFWPWLFYTAEIYVTIFVLSMTAMYSSFWLTGWLCAYYCFGISNFSHRLLVGFKRFLSSFLPHVLLLSFIGPFFMSILMFWMADIVLPIPLPTNNTQKSFVNPKVLINPAYKVMVTLLGCCVPFILTLGSTGVTITSLIRHINNMKDKAAGFTCPHFQVLINATRTMVLFLTFSVIFYVLEFLWLASLRNFILDLRVVISWFIIMSFPAAEAVIIIQAIPKLRKKISGRFCPRKRASRNIEDRTSNR